MIQSELLDITGDVFLAESKALLPSWSHSKLILTVSDD